MVPDQGILSRPYHGPEVALPLETSHRNGTDVLRRIYDALSAHSDKYRLDLIIIAPYGGDFKIQDRCGSWEGLVEMKTTHCTLGRDPATGELQLKHRAIHPSGKRLFFTWRTQWHFLFTSVTAEPQSNIKEDFDMLIPKCAIPSAWWNTNRDEWLSWDYRHCQRFKVPKNSPEELGRTIERIVDTARVEYPAIAPSIPMDDLPPEVVDGGFSGFPNSAQSDPGADRTSGLPDVDRAAAGNSDPRPGWRTLPFRKGFGDARHDENRGSYDSWCGAVLQELCRERSV